MPKWFDRCSIRVDDSTKLISRVSFLLKTTARPGAKEMVGMGEEVVWAAMQRVERQLLQRNLTVVQPEHWPKVHGIPAALETVWTNLLKNAQQHGREGTTIELGWRETETGYCFWVRNAGEPVPPEKRSTLFRPFHLLHERNSPHGLGLPIVQRMVELHDGVCHYAAEPSGNSVFSFTLPHSDPKDLTPAGTE